MAGGAFVFHSVRSRSNAALGDRAVNSSGMSVPWGKTGDLIHLIEVLHRPLETTGLIGRCL